MTKALFVNNYSTIRMILCGAKASALPPGFCPAFPREAIGSSVLSGDGEAMRIQVRGKRFALRGR